jgi:Uma2 family endonuclease
MSPVRRKPKRAVSEPEPTWDVAHLFPAQGAWTEEEYLALDTNHLVEFSAGFLEVLPQPTMTNQLLLGYLLGRLLAFVTDRDLGTAVHAPLPVRLWRRMFCEPDIVLMLKEHADRMGEAYWRGADLVMEIVSEGEENRERDLQIKRREYARARIPEYWIVDPQEERITVLRLAGKRYVAHGEFPKGAVASSHLLQGFTVDVSEALATRLPATRAKTTRRPRRGGKGK